MQITACQFFFATCLALLTLSCKTIDISESSGIKGLQVDCSKPKIDLQKFLRRKHQCVKDSYFANQEESAKRFLSEPIPCNQVSWVDVSQDLFGGDGDSQADVLNSSFFKIFNDWLGEEDRFDPSYFPRALDVHTPFQENFNNSILASAIAQELKTLISQAKQSIFVDIFLFGGSWGIDLARDLIKAADRGVEVVIVHDNVSVFAVGNEIRPLWDSLKEVARQHPKMVVLDANISPPNRVSSIPFGLERVSRLLANVVDATISLDGKSDHSKVLIVDAMYRVDRSEFTSALRPKVLIGSRNWVDSAASFYHDEAVIIEGPAAVVALLDYRSDLVWARKHSANSIDAASAKMLDSWLSRLESMAKGPLLVATAGQVSVESVQVSVNDEVRNLDSSIIAKVAAATQTIDLYGKIAYNWPLAIALKEAMARCVQVRIILDQQTPSSALLNASLPFMIMKAPRRTSTGLVYDVSLGGQRIEDEANLPVRWFLPFRPGRFFQSNERTDLAQEIHSKTMIIDDRYSLFGSVNMDSFTWAGGFREYSVWIDDPLVAQKSRQLFERLYNHPLLSIAHAVWLGEADPPEDLQDYLSLLQESSGNGQCPPSEPICNPSSVLSGGKDYRKSGPARTLIQEITARETQRIRQVFPEALLGGGLGQVKCRPIDASPN